MEEIPDFLLLAPIVLVILLTIGIIIAIPVYFRRAQPEKQSEQDAVQPESPSQVSAEPASLAREPEEPPPMALSETPAWPGEVMRVIRDERTGRVLVEVEGQQYAHIREIRDAQIGRRVLWAIADLVRFTGGMAVNPQALRNVSRDTSWDEPVPQRAVQREHEQAPVEKATAPLSDSSETRPVAPMAGPAVRVPSPREVPSPAAESPPFSSTSLGPPTQKSASSRVPGGSAQPARERYSMIDFFRRGFQPQASAMPVSGPTSFIDEIEEILQNYIRNLPKPLPHRVHVTTGPDNALQIEVGLDKYNSADDIPDPQIRALIKAAVAEWERR